MVGLFDVTGLESRHRVIIKCLQTSELSSYPLSWEAADGEGCARSPGGLRWQIIREMRWNNSAGAAWFLLHQWFYAAANQTPVAGHPAWRAQDWILERWKVSCERGAALCWLS